MIRRHIGIAAITFYMTAMAIGDDIAKRPLVLEKIFLKHSKGIYEYPKAAKKMDRFNGFDYILYDTTLVQYFCPAETKEEIEAERNELFSKCVFGGIEIRETCRNEIEPIAKEALDENNQHIECGMGDSKGKLYNIGYQYCFRSDEILPSFHKKYKRNFIKIMDLCYDHSKKITVYVTHKIYSPKIFHSEWMDELSWKTDWKINDYGIFEDDFKNMKTSRYRDTVA